jgi:hypothetical protein
MNQALYAHMNNKRKMKKKKKNKSLVCCHMLVIPANQKAEIVVPG